MPDTLYVSDLDGTLLTSSDKLSPRSLRILNGLIGRGLRFTYATARSLVSASRVTAGLRTDIPVIVYNGAFVMRAQDGEILRSAAFSEGERARARALLEELRAHPLVYSFQDGREQVSWLTAFENDGMRRYLAQRPGDPRLNPLQSEGALYAGDIFYYTCIGEKEELAPVCEAFRRDGRFRCTLQQELYRPEYWCEIMPLRATKAEAVRWLREEWGCGEVVAFGDAINDLPLFAQADRAYAVANAVPELRAAADGVIAANDEDGVACWLLAHAIPGGA